MSKSEGNIFQLSAALDRFGREAVIDYLISGHYRQPLAFGEEQLEQAAARVARIRNFLREHPPQPQPAEREPFVAERRAAFTAALADDFNTPRAIAEVFELIAEANRGELTGAPEALREMLAILGLESLAEPEEGAGEEAERLLAERERARAERDFERADALREELAGLGWEVRDSAGGARLVRRG
jgi:cysteinyl-tRNA synthetase